MSTEKVLEMKGGGEHVSAEAIRLRMLHYGTQIHEYLDHLEAEVDAYKFSVEKHGDALTVDIAFKATIHPKPEGHISK